MKNIVTVSVLVLVLAVCLVGNAFALRYPYNSPLNPGGEDHPWGGGNEGTINPNGVGGSKTPLLSSTGYPVIDFIVNEVAFTTTFQSLFNQFERKQTLHSYQLRSRNYSEKGAR